MTRCETGPPDRDRKGRVIRGMAGEPLKNWSMSHLQGEVIYFEILKALQEKVQSSQEKSIYEKGNKLKTFKTSSYHPLP